MKCYQCNNNAMYQAGPEKIPLCLQCYALMQQTLQRQNGMLQEDINYLSDSVDAMFGIRTGARYPIKQPVLVVGGTTHNHISIENSQIASLNTGNIQTLNQTIDALYSVNQNILADNIQKFGQKIIGDKDLTGEQKNDVVESLDFLSKELFRKPEQRKKSIAKILIQKIASITQFSANALTVWHILQPLLQQHF